MVVPSIPAENTAPVSLEVAPQASPLSQWLLDVAAYPAVLFGSMGLMVALVQVGRPGLGNEAVVYGTIIAALLAVLLLERWAPFDPRQKVAPATMGRDLVITGCSAVVASLARPAGLLVMAAVAGGASEAWGGSLWPSEWHLGAQFILAMVVVEFGQYWAHRLCHTFETLWRIHALHHSTDPLYIVAAGRSHPINAFLVTFCGFLPMVALGAGAEILLIHSGFIAVQGFFQHSNYLPKTHYLDYFFATPCIHRWHHSTVIEESCTNYGNNLTCWDLAFGSFFRPVDRRAPAHVGIDGMDFGGLASQLASPFRWKPLFTGDPTAAEANVPVPTASLALASA